MEKRELLDWLHETDERRLEELWRRADEVRRAEVGDEVHLRGLVEISNVCARECLYCGVRAGNAEIDRYRMSADEILACARKAVDFGYGTTVLQSGEDPKLTGPWVADLIHRIKAETGLAVTLSLGERSRKDWEMWKAAGADRYLLRFETSNRELFERIHPAVCGGKPAERIAMLRELRGIGFEVGSGVMIGIPGQSYEDLANDIELFAELDLDMIGVGPYLPHPETPMGRGECPALPTDQQVPNSEQMTYKTVALTRLACPRTNIPSTTALATVNRESGRELGLQRGANIVMPNLTPPEYRCKYEIYPAKACLHETAEHCRGCLERRILSLGRTVGGGRGDSRNWQSRQGDKAASPSLKAEGNTNG